MRLGGRGGAGAGHAAFPSAAGCRKVARPSLREPARGGEFQPGQATQLARPDRRAVPRPHGKISTLGFVSKLLLQVGLNQVALPGGSKMYRNPLYQLNKGMDEWSVSLITSSFE